MLAGGVGGVLELEMGLSKVSGEGLVECWLLPSSTPAMLIIGCDAKRLVDAGRIKKRIYGQCKIW